MKDWDLHAVPELALDLEALGRLDVLKVDPAEGRFESGDDLDDLVGVGLGQLDIEHVDVGKLLEEAGLALHDRLRGERADLAEAEDRSAIGDHRDEVGARGERGGLERVVGNGETGVGHPRRVSQRQVALVGEVLGRGERNLPGRRRAVVLERGLAERLFKVLRH
jgi:hypothetical protein